MRLIDADEFKEQLYRLYWESVGRKSETFYYLEAIKIVNDAPTVDAVPIIRCKDCKLAIHTNLGNILCDLSRILCGQNDFCSFGERKDDGN